MPQLPIDQLHLHINIYMFHTLINGVSMLLLQRRGVFLANSVNVKVKGAKGGAPRDLGLKEG